MSFSRFLDERLAHLISFEPFANNDERNFIGRLQFSWLIQNPNDDEGKFPNKSMLYDIECSGHWTPELVSFCRS